ncbi:MAG: hemerythrin domain-containing protein [Calditrichaeota bacterium]|nr:hemerythrin domain-containing protein [Calditrichota bacterium]
MENLQDLQNQDPLKRMVEKQTEQDEFSPMNPPEAYEPPDMDAIPYEKMPPFLQVLMDEHKNCIKQLDEFDSILNQLKEKGLVADPKIDEGLRNFFSFVDEKVVQHNLKEEKILFPTLQARFLEKGEHGQGLNPQTAVDMLEDDHIKLMQLAAVTFNFLGLSARLPDTASRAITLDAALEQGKALVEMLRLHIFREDSVVFSSAVELVSEKEFTEMEKQLSRFE